MVTTNAAMDATQEWIPLTSADAALVPAGYYVLDSEYVLVGGVHSELETAAGVRERVANGVWCTRGRGGSDSATHQSGADLIAYSPEAPVVVPGEALTVATLILTDIPTEDPLVDGAVWSDSGVLTMSAGPA